MCKDLNYAKTDYSELLDLVVAELERQGMEDVATELKEVIKQASNEKEFLAILNNYSGAFLGKEYLSLGRLDLRGEKEEAKKEKKWLKDEDGYFNGKVIETSSRIYHPPKAPPEEEVIRRPKRR